MFTASGLRVRFLRVYEKSGYKPTKWIRYITKAGEYQRRLWENYFKRSNDINFKLKFNIIYLYSIYIFNIFIK